MEYLRILIVFSTLITYTECGNLCLSCNFVVIPKLCNNVVRCGDHEVCATHKYVSAGVTLYDVGCSRSYSCSSKRDMHVEDNQHKRFGDGKITICSECCNNTMLCNINGQCGSDSYDIATKLVCYHCDQALTPDSCNRIEKCRDGQVCTVKKVSVGLAGDRYRLGCSDDNCQITARAPIVGKRHRDTLKRYKDLVKRINTPCEQCCATSLCNERCIAVPTAISTTTSTTTATSTATTKITTIVPTTTIIPTTTPRPSLHLSTFAYINQGTVTHENYTRYVDYGTDVNVLCIGNLNSTVVWQAQTIVGNSLPTNVHVNGEMLSIHSFQRQNNGHYLCTVTERTGIHVRLVNLIGRDKASTQMTTTTETMTPAATTPTLRAPHITLYSDPKTVLFGQNVTLLCMAKGHPTPTISWDVLLLSHSGVPPNTHSLFHRTVIQIEGYRSDNDGQYRCTASNSLGKDTAIIHITGH